MKKIISLFQRNYDGDRLVRDEVVPGAEWVLAGEGVATQKFDGTACRIEFGRLFKRYDAKHGKQPPAGFIPCQSPDPVTGHWPGWVPVREDAKEDKYHVEARKEQPYLPDGNYELVGPKIQGNPENYQHHRLVPHGVMMMDPPRSFEALREWFMGKDIEGIVWHHPDGRMVKIKKKDFGLRRKD